MLLRVEDKKGNVGWFNPQYVVTLSPTFNEDKKRDGGYFVTFVHGSQLDISAKDAQMVLNILAPGEKLSDSAPEPPDDVKRERPQPVRYTIQEGGRWHDWSHHTAALVVHAVEFDNGWIFDVVNGWRR